MIISKMKFACFLTKLVLIQLRYINCSNYSQIVNLHTYLFRNYSVKVFPLQNQSDTVNVRAEIAIANINNFDELSGQIELTLIFYMRWTDEHLTWNPSNYGGKSTVLLPPEDIWRPQFFVMESNDVNKEIGNVSVLVRIHSTGEILWKFGKVLKLVCSVDVTYFPFDTQICHIKISGWAYERDEVMLYAVNAVVSKQYYTSNSQWKLQSATVNNGTSKLDDVREPFIEMIFILKRRSDFFVVYIIIPVIFLGGINNLVFIMPASSGERTSVAITTFLSFIVFFEMINNNVPESSLPLANIYYYILFLLVYSSMLLFLCVISLRIHDKESEVPAKVKQLITALPCLCGKRKMDSVPKRKTSIATELPNDGNISKINQEMIPEITWKDVGKTFDEYCFVLTNITFWLITGIAVLKLYFNRGI